MARSLSDALSHEAATGRHAPGRGAPCSLLRARACPRRRRPAQASQCRRVDLGPGLPSRQHRCVWLFFRSYPLVVPLRLRCDAREPDFSADFVTHFRATLPRDFAPLPGNPLVVVELRAVMLSCLPSACLESVPSPDYIPMPRGRAPAPSVSVLVRATSMAVRAGRGRPDIVLRGRRGGRQPRQSGGPRCGVRRASLPELLRVRQEFGSIEADLDPQWTPPPSGPSVCRLVRSWHLPSAASSIASAKLEVGGLSPFWTAPTGKSSCSVFRVRVVACARRCAHYLRGTPLNRNLCPPSVPSSA